MRRRLGLLRPRSMARRVGGNPPRIDLSPRARVVAGWLAALVLVIGVAFVVGRLGDQAGGSTTTAEATGSGAGSPLPITFGRVLGAGGQVDPASHTERFTAGDTFAYSIDAEPPPNRQVYVEVMRLAGGSGEPVQTPAPQPVPEERTAVGFQVPAQVLLDAFGPGEYLMRIYARLAGTAIAEGRFTLVEDVAPSGS